MVYRIHPENHLDYLCCVISGRGRQDGHCYHSNISVLKELDERLVKAGFEIELKDLPTGDRIYRIRKERYKLGLGYIREGDRKYFFRAATKEEMEGRWIPIARWLSLTPTNRGRYVRLWHNLCRSCGKKLEGPYKARCVECTVKAKRKSWVRKFGVSGGEPVYLFREQFQQEEKKCVERLRKLWEKYHNLQTVSEKAKLKYKRVIYLLQKYSIRIPKTCPTNARTNKERWANYAPKAKKRLPRLL